jgi:hypothetical protein
VSAGQEKTLTSAAMAAISAVANTNGYHRVSIISLSLSRESLRISARILPSWAVCMSFSTLYTPPNRRVLRGGADCHDSGNLLKAEAPPDFSRSWEKWWRMAYDGRRPDPCAYQLPAKLQPIVVNV